MKRLLIDPSEFNLNIFKIWEKNWFLLTAGTKNKYNMMTVAWGSIGRMWNKHFIQVVVRPSRYTFNFMNEFETFNLSAFPKDYKKDLGILGSTSGKDGDKLLKTSLTATPGIKIETPMYNEAELVIEAKTIYSQDMDNNNFIPEYIEECYPGGTDYHRIYFGEVLHIEGVDKYLK